MGSPCGVKMELLFDIADQLDVVVEFAPLANRDGEYRDDLRRIRLREDMSERLMRWKFGHELGHAVHGHRPDMFGGTSARQEREANEWAARLLIDLDRFREIELLRGGHVASMAHDFGIVSDGILAFQRMLERLGDNVYLKPQHGAGQYANKIPA